MHESNAFIHDWKTFKNATFSADYKSKDWLSIMQIDKENPNLSFHNYIEEVEKMISNHTPLKKLKNKISNFKANLGLPLVYKSL